MRPSGRFISDLGSEITCLNIVQKLIDRLPRDNAPSLSTFLGHLSGSKAPTTQRVYLREISLWLDWCETCGLCALPAHGASVALYLSSRLSRAASKTVVELAHAAIVWLHELFGISPNPARSAFARYWDQNLDTTRADVSALRPIL